MDVPDFSKKIRQLVLMLRGSQQPQAALYTTALASELLLAVHEEQRRIIPPGHSMRMGCRHADDGACDLDPPRSPSDQLMPVIWPQLDLKHDSLVQLNCLGSLHFLIARIAWAKPSTDPSLLPDPQAVMDQLELLLGCQSHEPTQPNVVSSAERAGDPGRQAMTLEKSAPAVSGEATLPHEINQSVFRQSPGGTWELRYEDEWAQLPDSVGLARIWRLLKSDPDRGIGAAELMGESIAQNIASLPSSDGGQVADSRAISEIKGKIEQIQKQIDDTVNPEKTEELKQEQQDLSKRLKNARGKWNRKRNMQRTPTANASNAVRKSIDTALASLQKQMPSLHKYLSGRIETGQTCYFINSGESWLTDAVRTPNIP